MSKSRTFMTKALVAVMFLLAIPMTTGCMEKVPPGFVGMAYETTGFRAEVLTPGRHSCWGRCEMHLLEATDDTFQISMSILDANGVNISTTVSVLCAVDREEAEQIRYVFENIMPTDGSKTRELEVLFKKYIFPKVDETARMIVSKYTTGTIVKERPRIKEELKAAIEAELVKSVVKVKMVTVNNIDPPKSITAAQEEKVRTRIGIETALAQAEVAEAQATARIALAQIERQERLLRAKTDADANKLLASSLSPAYLAYRQMEVLERAADGENNMMFIPYSSQSIGGKGGVDLMQTSIDASLMKELLSIEKKVQ